MHWFWFHNVVSQGRFAPTVYWTIWGAYHSSNLLSDTQVLRRPDLVSGQTGNGNPKYLVTNKMLGAVWMKLRNRLASIKSDTSMIEVSSDYASHFYDMYFQQHDGKHLTGDRMKILMLNLPFVMWDLIAEEVTRILTYDVICDIICMNVISYMTS